MFLKFKPKNTERRHFLCQIQEFLFLRQTLNIAKSEGANFKLDYITFNLQYKKNRIRHFG